MDTFDLVLVAHDADRIGRVACRVARRHQISAPTVALLAVIVLNWVRALWLLPPKSCAVLCAGALLA